jgi:hypothetical protein
MGSGLGHIWKLIVDMEKPIKKTNYTKFSDIDGANAYARSNEKDLQNIFQYVGNMGATQTITVGGKVFTVVNGLIQSIV